MFDYQQPDASGHFGIYGGTFASETLTHAIDQLRDAYARYKDDPDFLAEFRYELAHFVGRPSPVYHAARSSREMGGAQIYLKREDLNHTGAHKINNVIGQAMLARRMGKPRVIAETGAGQHGVATATICARYGLECVVYMGAADVKRQSPNVYRMNLLGATVVPVESGSRTLKDALNEAMRDWVTNVEDTFYIIGTVAGPHPYPAMVRDFQKVIGEECIQQMPGMLAQQGITGEAQGKQPDVVVACVGVAATPWASSTPTFPSNRPASLAWKPRARAWTAASIRRPSCAAVQACCMAIAPICCRTTTARSPRRTASAPAWTTPAWARSMPTWLTSDAPSTWASPTRRRWRPSTTCAAPKASSRHSNPATPWPTRSSWPRPCALTNPFS